MGNIENIKERFITSNSLVNFSPPWNIFPESYVPTITRNSPNKVTMMRWGLTWSKDSKFGPINIRSESFYEKPFFKDFLLNKRCLIIANSFFEWGEINLEGKPEKYPFCFYLKNMDLFGFAGIYNFVSDAEGKKHYSCAILTTFPNKLVSRIHNRMPVIIKQRDENFWLDPKGKSFERLNKLLIPYPENQMKFHIVSKRVNNPNNDDPDLVKPLKL